MRNQYARLFVAAVAFNIVWGTIWQSIKSFTVVWGT
jgi:hypothetical protein